MRKLLLASTAILIPAMAFAQTCTMPAAATAAGYTTPTFRGISLDQWKAGDGGSSLASCGVSQKTDGTIYIRGGDCNDYGDQMASVISFGGGGYFEATFSLAGTPRKAADGWSAFWGRQSGAHNVEVDMAEIQDGLVTHGIHDWIGDGNQIATPWSPASNYPPPTTNPDGTPWKWSDPHRWGWLWTPATATTQGLADFYLDGVLQTGSVTWNQGGPYSWLDTGGFMLILGTGSPNPMTVYDVSVWQKDGSKNTGSVNLSVNALTGRKAHPCENVR